MYPPHSDLALFTQFVGVIQVLVRIPELKSNITGRKIPSSAYLCDRVLCTVFSKLAQLDMVHGAGHGSLGKCL